MEIELCCSVLIRSAKEHRVCQCNDERGERAGVETEKHTDRLTLWGWGAQGCTGVPLCTRH